MLRVNQIFLQLVVAINFIIRIMDYLVYIFLCLCAMQWECKADMDSQYRFGEIAVNCEGYSYPDDPYVLKGSCGVCYYTFNR